MSGNREFLSKIYIRALDLTEVFVIVTTEDRCKIGFGESSRAQRDAAGAKITFLAWCDPRVAETLALMARDRLHDDADPDSAERLLLIVAEELGAELRTDAELQATALAAVERVETQFKALLKSGELQDLNSRYRDYRLAKNARGEPAQKYNQFLWAERVKLVQKTAALVKSGRRMSTKLKDAISTASRNAAGVAG